MSITVNEWFMWPEKQIPLKTCNKIIKLAEGNWEESSVSLNTEVTDEERKTGIKEVTGKNNKVRISDIYWSNERWLYDLIWPYMMTANRDAGWNYEITGAESCQITRYGPGGFYNFHADGKGCHLAKYSNSENKWLYGNVRKISMSLVLNDKFEGGDFEFASQHKDKIEITSHKLKRGSLIFFPSHMTHRVAEVTKGIRHSLVCWFLGPPFK